MSMRLGSRKTQTTAPLRVAAWREMRRLGRFTVSDLLYTVASGEQKDAAGSVHKLIQQLQRVGVVAAGRRTPGLAPTSPGLVVYRLVRDLGPACPVWRRADEVLFDPNSGAEIPPLEAGGEHG